MSRWLFMIFLLFCFPNLSKSDDYYDLLGIPRDADNRQIRKAFKKLALKMHPDKNTEDGAHEKFLKITRAYEILKDDEQRKKYDMFGEKAFEEGGNDGYGRYESWNYYHEDFGIYDDDEDVVTLDYGDFTQLVIEGHDIWFINFYSPRCGHCHDLAPTWRRVAKQLAGVIRIGAVNCQDEFMLCNRQGIRGYPTLNVYTAESIIKYQGAKDEDELIKFISQYIPNKMVNLWAGNYESTVSSEASGAWLMIMCSDEITCPDSQTRKLVAASLYGLAKVGLIDCDQDKSLCVKLRGKNEDEGGVVFFPDHVEKEHGIRISASVYDHQEIIREVMEHVAGPIELTASSLDELKKRLEKDMGPAWIIHFTNNGEGDKTEFKKLSPLLPRLRVGKVDCSTSRSICREHFITKYPSFVVYKPGGHFEMYYGKTGVQEVAVFGRLASQARTMETFTDSELSRLINAGQHVVVDFFAPWCPPCMNFLPEFRKASTIIGGSIRFGTVDCTIHQRLCNEHGIRSYPTTIFFNGSKPHQYQGGHDAQALGDFVQDVLRPVVITLTEDSFQKEVGKKTEEEMWLVDFFAPWCGPCRQLAPHWSNLGRMMEKYPNIKVAKVDCTEEAELCHMQGVRSYPTIRMYPLKHKGTSRYYKYDQYHRDADSLQQWVVSHLPSNVENLTPYSFQHQVLRSSQPWLVEFFAPWCSHCVEFAPEFERAALALKGEARVGKVNCDKYKQLCSQAGIKGYPTLRFYRGADKHEVQDYYSYDIASRQADNIVRIVEDQIEYSHLPGTKEKKPTNHDEL